MLTIPFAKRFIVPAERGYFAIDWLFFNDPIVEDVIAIAIQRAGHKTVFIGCPLFNGLGSCIALLSTVLIVEH